MRNTFIDRPILDQVKIDHAADHLRRGQLVAFPTETVYGLGADASNEKALENLFAAKGRPANHPVIVHLASLNQINDWGIEIADYARLLGENFWPGPLTLIVKKSPHVLPQVTGGQDTIGLRVPNHPIALALLKTFAGGIAAPSANKYGCISPTSAEHVRAEFGDQIPMIIDGGNCAVGIESTIIDTTGPTPKILRPGMISEDEVLAFLQSRKVALNQSVASTTAKEIRVPGSDKVHYAPKTPMLLLDKYSLQALLTEVKMDTSFAILALSKLDQVPNPNIKANVRNYIQASPNPISYARDLYNNLRQLDTSNASTILVESVPDSSKWEGIANRLQRAAAKFY